MPQSIKLDRSRLHEIIIFLDKIGETNESTEYSTSQEYIVESIIALSKMKGRKDISDDFDTPYIHHLITIQKWLDELKLIANEALNEVTHGGRHTLFKKKIVDMDGYDMRQFINYLREDGLLK